MKQAGTDASDQFDKIHSLGVIKQHIPDSMIVGKIDQKSFDEHNVHLRNHELKLGIPLLSSVLSSYDMEVSSFSHLI